MYLKNLFAYKGLLSRIGFLLILIAFFLTAISFVKGIQVLIFIPAFVLSIFLYSLLDFYMIKRNLRVNLIKDKKRLYLNIEINKNKNYNFILAKKKGLEIDFLKNTDGSSYKIESGDELILYVYGRFNIFRKKINLGKVSIKDKSDESENTYIEIKKYTSGDNLNKIDSLRTSLSDSPYIKNINIKENASKESRSNLDLLSNKDLREKDYNKTKIFHLFMIILISLAIFIEWGEALFNSIIIASFLLAYIFRKKLKNISKKTKGYILLVCFSITLIITFILKDMTGIGSVFLVQILTLSYMQESHKKESFLFIFLALFVFVAISLFSKQIWFILFFLVYLFISSYLLSFISGTESFDEKDYSTMGNKLSFFKYIKTSFFIIFFTFLLFFLLPHGKETNNPDNPLEKGEIVSGFSEEINTNNVSDIKSNREKVIVVENINLSDIDLYGLKYFRGARLNYFRDNKWSNFGTPKRYFKEDRTRNPRKSLDIKYYMKNSNNLFFPASPSKINIKNDYNEIKSLKNDSSIIILGTKTSKTLNIKAEFLVEKGGELIDRDDIVYDYSLELSKRNSDLIKKFVESIDEKYKENPKILSDYIKYRAGFTYSVENPATNLESFLYREKRGHCEYYATSLALSLQSLGYKAVVVNGYADGEYNEIAKSLIFRGDDAHSWVELFDDNLGVWQRLDPTPSIIETESYNVFDTIIDVYDYMEIKWFNYIANYTNAQQYETYKYLYNQKFIILLAIVSIILVLMIKKRVLKYIKMTKKERFMNWLSKKSKLDLYSLDELEKLDKELSKETSKAIYGDKKVDLGKLKKKWDNTFKKL